MQAFHRIALFAGAMLLAGCASDGTTFLTTAEQTPPPPVAEESAPPPEAAQEAPPPARAAERKPAKQEKQAAKPDKKATKPEKQATRQEKPVAAGGMAPAAGSKFDGSWQFSNGEKACTMTLSAAGKASGTVSSSGECWNAYTKAKGWKLQGNEMVLTDSGNQPIARLQSTGATRYDGYGADGEPVVLIR